MRSWAYNIYAQHDAACRAQLAYMLTLSPLAFELMLEITTPGHHFALCK
jgi:hypothetical protein